MSFDDLIRSGVALANELTASLQPTVRHEAWTADDGLGGATYATGVDYGALIESNNKIRRLPDGQEIAVDHVVSILQPVAANGASGRREPIDPRDLITLPDGTVCGVVAIVGLIDPDTSASYYHQIYLVGGGRSNQVDIATFDRTTITMDGTNYTMDQAA